MGENHYQSQTAERLAVTPKAIQRLLRPFDPVAAVHRLDCSSSFHYCSEAVRLRRRTDAGGNANRRSDDFSGRSFPEQNATAGIGCPDVRQRSTGNKASIPAIPISPALHITAARSAATSSEGEEPFRSRKRRRLNAISSHLQASSFNPPPPKSHQCVRYLQNEKIAVPRKCISVIFPAIF